MKKINKSDLQYLVNKAQKVLAEAATAREAAITSANNEKIHQFLADHKHLMSVEIVTLKNGRACAKVHMPPQVAKRYDILDKATSNSQSHATYEIGGLHYWALYTHKDVHAWVKPKVDALCKLVEELRFSGSAEGLNQINDFIKSLAPVKGVPAKVRKATAKKTSKAAAQQI